MQVVSQSASQSGSQSVSQQINDFGQKMEILYLYVFRQMGLAILFDVH